MGYKNFNMAISVRLFFLVLFSMISIYFYLGHYPFYTYLISLILMLFFAINTLSYFNKINNLISFFLLGIKNEDTSLKIPEKSSNKSINNIFKGINNLNDILKQAKIKISTQEQYFKTIINQSTTGLFSVGSNNRVIHINPAASKLIGLQEQHHINSLNKIDDNLAEFIKNKENNEQTRIFENKYGQKLLFKVSVINILDQDTILVSVSDITKELHRSEVDAWIKLARTLSHEIMNNITPITTLSQVVLKYYKTNNKIKSIDEMDEKTISKTVKALSVIEERSVALMNFVENYRKFTKLPEPVIKQENISEIIENCILAISSFPNFKEIELVKKIPEKLLFNTDANLLSQVIINLLKNALEAFKKSISPNSFISVKLKKEFENVYIEIANNAKAIPPEIKDQIFIPFFTTKEEGSGIGLSLSKQILMKMDADISLKQSNSDITAFEVILR